ncbi:MAG: hypothetical protein ABR577_14175 [Pyrinomonadaceae bacterium]
MSAWGSVLAATLCPHMAQDHSCCHAMMNHGDMSSQGMGEMQMATPVSRPNADRDNAETLGQPAEECAHCLGHTGLPLAPAAAFSASVQTKRNTNALAPQAANSLVTLVAPFTATVTAKQNAPPVASSPRYVLLSVFRI